jgi:predicted transcriptional regulator
MELTRRSLLKRTAATGALAMAGSMTQARDHLKGMVADFMHLNRPPRSLDEIECDVEDVGMMAHFAATARTPIVRNKYRQDTIEAPPELEYGTRLGKQLYKIGKMMFWLGANHQRIAKRVALSSIPVVRLQVLREIHNHNFCTIKQLCNNIRVSERIIRQECDNLYYIGMLDRRIVGRYDENTSRGRPPYGYSCHVDYIKSMGIMMSDKWMGPNERKIEAQRIAEEEAVRRPALAQPAFVPMPDDFWPGEE